MFSQDIVSDLRPEGRQKAFVTVYLGLRKFEGDSRAVRG
jgi:hypothetical protein